jgi:hypothetical protein
VGTGQNVCSRSCIEGYRGISGAKNAFLPQKTPPNPPKFTPLSSRASLGHVPVSQLSVIPRRHPRYMPLKKIEFKATSILQ